MSAAELSLSELFPESDYEFKLTLRRAEPHAFFRRSEAAEPVLRERARWLAEEPGRYRALQPEGEPVLREFASLAAGWPEESRLAMPAAASSSDLLRAVGSAFEPDVLFLTPDAAGQFRLRGGALCFPTGWALEEKMGETLPHIHGVVPGLNDAIGPAIQQFLHKLRPGVAYLRQNWGLAATDELNLHPARKLPPPTLPVRLEALWLRVEHQALFALPETRGIVFGIRIALHRLDRVAASPARSGLRRALETMPSDLSSYKRLDAVRGEVVRQLC